MDGAEAPRRLPPPRELGRNWIHLAALSAFAVAQPVLHALGDAPAYFAAHDAGRWDIVAFALLVAVVPATLGLALEAAAGLAWPPARRAVHLGLLGLAVALLVLHVARALPAGLAIALAVLAGTAAGTLYARTAWARSLTSALAIAPVAFVVVFVFFSPVEKLTLEPAAKAADVTPRRHPPIVVVQLDAFPLNLLLGPGARVDTARYPNFARLLGQATWYRNATTAHENTPYSVPSILDGRWPEPSDEPVLADHPHNLFTLLGRTYHEDAYQSVADLCPPGLCTGLGRQGWTGRMRLLADDTRIVYEHLLLPDSLRSGLPSITDSWRDFGSHDAGGSLPPRTPRGVLSLLAGGARPGAFLGMVRRMVPGPRPLLSYMHVLLPHEPRQYLPDGHEYQRGADFEPALDGRASFADEYLTDQAFQRTMLQTGAVDRLLGRLIDQLRRAGMWKRALVVVVADHGESFQPARGWVARSYPGRLSWRRAVSPQNIGDIAPVPLIVKYPGQARGRTDDRWVKTIDVLPTITQAVGVRLPFHVDGHSLLVPGYRGTPTVQVEQTVGTRVTASRATVQAQRRATLARQLALFGSGAGADKLYRIGPDPGLIGRPVSSVPRVDAGALHATFAQRARFAHVDPRAVLLPSFVMGRIQGGAPGGRPLALAVNGRIAATGWSFRPLGRRRLSFSMLVPDSVFRAGSNRVALYEIAVGGRALEPLTGPA